MPYSVAMSKTSFKVQFGLQTNSLTKLALIYQRKHNSTPLALLGALKKAEYLILDTGSSLDNSFFSYGTFQALPTLTIIGVSLLR